MIRPLNDGELVKLSYTIRESQRAKRVILKFFSAQGLEIVIPKGFNRKLIPEILRKNQKWLIDTTQQVSTKEEDDFHLEGKNTLPEKIFLRAIKQEWKVRSKVTSKQLLTLAEKNTELIFSGKMVNNMEAAYYLLGKWVRNKAELYLKPWLQQAAAETGVSYQKVTIRDQKTRWGSCSSQKNISLNCKLLFLPHHLVRYVLIHELCHTIQLNHSPEFWQLVARLEPEYSKFRIELRKARKYIPAWYVKANY